MKTRSSFRKVNELSIRINNSITKIDRNKSFVSNMFGKDNSKEVKEFIKTNKIKLKIQDDWVH